MWYLSERCGHNLGQQLAPHPHPHLCLHPCPHPCPHPHPHPLPQISPPPALTPSIHADSREGEGGGRAWEGGGRAGGREGVRVEERAYLLEQSQRDSCESLSLRCSLRKRHAALERIGGLGTQAWRASGGLCSHHDGAVRSGRGAGGQGTPEGCCSYRQAVGLRVFMLLRYLLSETKLNIVRTLLCCL